MNKFVVAVLLILTMTGCVEKNNLRAVQDANGDERSFQGIVDIINQPGNTNVLFIHGMGGYSGNGDTIDPCHVINDVREAVGLKPVPLSGSGSICTDRFTLDGKTVNLHAMYWSEITGYRKLLLQAVDEDQLFEDNRAGGTKWIKKNLINHGFSDAIMYTGVFRQDILDKVLFSYKALNQANPDAKTAIVTFSLGSSILLDSLDLMEKRGQEDLLKNKVEMVYLLANQIPLIQTGTRPKNKSETPLLYEPLSWIFRESKSTLDANKIRIAAFSDPNDLLSYPLDVYNVGALRGQFVNVALSVAKYTYYVPFRKDKLSAVNYLAAHTGFVYDEQAKDLLLHGNAPAKAVQ